MRNRRAGAGVGIGAALAAGVGAGNIESLGRTRRMRYVRHAMRRLVAPLVCLLIACLPFEPAGAQQDGGLSVERIRLPRAPEVRAGDRTLTLVRVDPRRYRLTVLTGRQGPPRPLDAWVRDHHLSGGINAGMFLPNRRPVGTLIADGEVISDRRPRGFDAVLGWNPVRRSAPFVAAGGRGCAANLDAMRRRYRSLVQGFRMMIDCEGRALDWPTRRRYSAAALGADDHGRAVFLHVRTPYRMGALNRMIADLDLGIRGLVYMEGGPEASLVVRDGAHRITEIGSWEDGFNENDDNRQLWDIPNVIGFARR